MHYGSAYSQRLRRGREIFLHARFECELLNLKGVKKRHRELSSPRRLKILQ